MSAFAWVLVAFLRVPACEWDMGDGTFLPDPCRYELPSGEVMFLRRPNVRVYNPVRPRR